MSNINETLKKVYIGNSLPNNGVYCGIYKIENLLNSKIYIGQSIDIFFRWKTHCYNYNSNKALAIDKAIHKYGKENFSFQIIELCSQEQLNTQEIYYIEKFNTYFGNGYNHTQGGQDCGHNSLKKKVIQTIIETGETIIFNSIADAARTYGVDSTNISRVCNGLTYSSCNSFWNFIDENGNKIPTNRKLKNIKRVCCKNYKEKKIFNSIKDAAQFLSINRDKLSNMLYQGIVEINDYSVYFCDEKGDIIGTNPFRQKSTQKRIKSTDLLTGEINYYESAAEAARILNIDNSAIRKCCNGKLKKYKNKIWEDI